MQGLTSLPRSRFLLWRSAQSGQFFLTLAGASVAALSGCASQPASPSSSIQTLTTPHPAADWVVASPRNTPRPPFKFKADDDRLLDEIERGSFWYLWNACDPATGMVHDRTSAKFASVAGVGFQLAAIPAAIERHWITKDEGRERTVRILQALDACPTNRKSGVFYHFLEDGTAKPRNSDHVSTIDSALLFAGMVVSGEYFGGEVRQRTDRFLDAADWSFFVMNNPRPKEPYLKGFITLGWTPKKFADPTGPGTLSPYAWADAGDEQRLVCFLAAGAADPAHGVEPSIYYRLRRMLGSYGDSGVHVWFPWSGALFTHFFAECFIDYAHMSADDPGAHGVAHSPRVDWWENARRGAAFHRLKCIENPEHLSTLGENCWGLTASDSAKGYAVPGVYPHRVATTDQVPQIDYAVFDPKDDFGDDTIAPYGAGCCIMFSPDAAVSSLRYAHDVQGPDGHPLVWRDPGKQGETGEYGFRDAFNLGTNWVAPDCVAIDQGPLVLSIENARSGLIWKLFDRAALSRRAMRQLGLEVKANPGR